MEAGTGEATEANPLKITVKFGKQTIPISVSPNTTVKDLKALLQPITDVLPRGQKLIFKGKMLVDQMTLRESEVASGSKVMLIASQGLHQGGGPTLKDAKTRPISRTSIASSSPIYQKEVIVDKNRFELWKHTGVVALSNTNLKAIPEEVWNCGPFLRFLDVSNNFIQELPARIGLLSSIQKLLLNGNGLSDKSVQWEGLTSLKHLTILSANHNLFTKLPCGLGALSSLRHLDLASNNLITLPDDIGLLTNLEILKANDNRINSIPTSIGDCTSLIEVDLSSNLLTELPDTFGHLRNLKVLQLSNNALTSLPCTLFKMCQQLSTLNLHNTEITMDILRQFEGWEDFDKRRLSKHQKQLDFHVIGSEEFDEGADKC